MTSQILKLICRIQIAEDEFFTLPEALSNIITAGDWLVTIEKLPLEQDSKLIRGHQAFLNGYEPSDEGLYDDYT